MQDTRHAPRSTEVDRAQRPAGLVIESGIAEMRELLARMKPASDAEALKALRNAFPASSLATRVAAVTALITAR